MKHAAWMILLLALASACGKGVPDKASVDGKYAELAVTIDCPKDEATYGTFKDYGRSDFTEWCGQKVPDKGLFWVYVAPKWYVWKKQVK